MSALLRKSCHGILFGAQGTQLRSRAFPLLAVCSQKKITPDTNERAVIHTSSKLSSAALTRGTNYTKHWFNERAVAIGLVAAVPVAMVYPCDAVNYALGVLIPFHNYWGLHHIILDYVPRGIALKSVEYLSMVACAVQLGGFAYINYKDLFALTGYFNNVMPRSPSDAWRVLRTAINIFSHLASFSARKIQAFFYKKPSVRNRPLRKI